MRKTKLPSARTGGSCVRTAGATLAACDRIVATDHGGGWRPKPVAEEGAAVFWAPLNSADEACAISVVAAAKEHFGRVDVLLIS
jgi:NAD(P)-dependent dehydrogenase (short-subunit alcohol dehydrogenase family)